MCRRVMMPGSSTAAHFPRDGCGGLAPPFPFSSPPGQAAKTSNFRVSGENKCIENNRSNNNKNEEKAEAPSAPLPPAGSTRHGAVLQPGPPTPGPGGIREGSGGALSTLHFGSIPAWLIPACCRAAPPPHAPQALPGHLCSPSTAAEEGWAICSMHSYCCENLYFFF